MQMKIEFAQSKWEARIQLFLKDSDERVKQSNEQVRRIQQLMVDLHDRALHEADLHKRREDMVKKHHELSERQAVIDAYNREVKDISKLIEEV